MKKLVTIVSAVMMLLMLAACAPGLSIDKEQQAAITKGNKAIVILGAITPEGAENKDGGKTYTLKEDYEDESLVVDTVTYSDVTVASGSIYTTSCKTSGSTETATVDIDASVSWTENKSDAEKKATYSVDVTFKGTMTSTSGTGDDAGITLDIDYFTVDGVKYTETLSYGYALLQTLING